ncbi:MAG TPA: GNAT family N-acetyltransferase [Bacteroidia bacterium]|nr:GNAT family N-acetyltransferase [Bacteroidia bacterium]
MLETKRLRLRKITPEDAPAIFGLRKNVRVHDFIYRPLQTKIEEAEDIVKRVENGWLTRQSIGWAAEHKETGTLLAACGFNRIEAENLRAEIGGEMHPDFWGKNFAQEGLGAIIRFGFETMNLHTVEARVISGNRSAIALLENNGFVQEGHLHEYGFFHGKSFDLLIFALRNPGHRIV